MGITQNRLPATRVAAGRLPVSAFCLLSSAFYLLSSDLLPSDLPVLPYFVANSTVVRKTSRARSSMISGVMISIASFVV